MSGNTCLRLVIHGRVQGVGYRESMREAAGRLGISGWVRNRLDGTVEAVVCGASTDVESLLDWSRRGPPAARVDRVEQHPAEGEFSGFERRPSA